MNLAPIAYEKDYDRHYIPLPGGWEVQTKGKGSTFRICEPGDDPMRLPVAPQPYLHETLERMARDIHAAYDSLQRQVDALEALRPHWAQGHSDDSIAAQTATAALAQLWEMLGANNQTEAAGKLRALVDGSWAREVTTLLGELTRDRTVRLRFSDHAVARIERLLASAPPG